MPILTLGTIAAATGLASQIGGAIGSAKARKAEEKRINTRQRENQAFYDRESNKDFFDTNVARSAITQLDKSADKAVEQADTAAARAGGTSDSKLATRGRVQEAKQGALTDLAGQGTQYKANLRSEHQGQQRFYDQAYSDLQEKKAESFANLGEKGGDLFGKGLTAEAGSGSRFGNFLNKSGF